MTEQFIYHLVEARHWHQASSAQTVYYPPTYKADGFTHGTSDPGRLLEVANHFYTDIPGDWLCLQMTEASLNTTGVEVVYEPAAPVGDKNGRLKPGDTTLFPHLQGGIHPSAVLKVFTVTREDGGRFLGIDGLTARD